MNSSRARAAERLLAALPLTFTAVFYATAAWLILTVVSSWAPRTVMLTLTAASALGSVLLMQSAWRHSFDRAAAFGSRQ